MLTLALIIDEEGFPKYSGLYPGNQYEASTLMEMIQSFLREWNRESRSIPCSTSRAKSRGFLVWEAVVANPVNRTRLIIRKQQGTIWHLQ